MQLSLETDTPKIYVACLAAYNAGILHGEWIDATKDLDDMWRELRNILASSPIPQAEEWAIHDSESFGDVRISEYESMERIHELACWIGDHDEIGILALNRCEGDIEKADEALENYMGCYTGLADYAQALTEETTEIPKSLVYYIDYERMGRDMERNGDVFTIETRFDQVHVFLNH